MTTITEADVEAAALDWLSDLHLASTHYHCDHEPH